MWRNCNNIHLHSLEGRISPGVLAGAVLCCVWPSSVPGGGIYQLHEWTATARAVVDVPSRMGLPGSCCWVAGVGGNKMMEYSMPDLVSLAFVLSGVGWTLERAETFHGMDLDIETDRWNSPQASPAPARNKLPKGGRAELSYQTVGTTLPSLDIRVLELGRGSGSVWR